MINAANIVNFTAHIDVFDSGVLSESGTPVALESYSVIAETARGKRWTRLTGVEEIEYSEDGFAFPKTNYEARKFAEKLADKLNNIEEPKLNPDVWTRTTSVYGSLAWSRQDEMSLMDEEELRHHGGL